MTQLEQIIALGNMGYSKEEITTLMGGSQPTAAPVQPTVAPAQPTATPVQPANNVDFLEALKILGQQMAQPAQQSTALAQPTAVPVAQPATPAQQTVTEQQTQQPSINLTAEDLVKLTQGIAVQTAAGSIETPKSANDIILGMLDVYESTIKKEE